MPTHIFARLLVAIAFGLFACGAQAQGRTKIPLVTAPVLDVSLAPNIGVPLALTYWDPEGLDVDVQPGNATMHLQALLGGQADIMYGGPATAFHGAEKGAKLRFAVFLSARTSTTSSFSRTARSTQSQTCRPPRRSPSLLFS